MLDNYEIEFLGKNLFDYDNMFWFAHDFYYRLKDLSKLVFHVEPELDIENYIKNMIVYEWKSNNRTYTFFMDGRYQVLGLPGFSNLIPMVLAEVN